MPVSLAIKDYLTTHGIKQSFVAKQCGWSRQKINCIVNGKQNITADEMVTVCDAVGVPYDYFFTASIQDSA